MINYLFRLLLLSIVALSSAEASELRIAVASNFLPVMQELVAGFQKTGDTSVRISAGSSGKHYAQIVNGAPYDVFFSADAAKAILLEQQGLGVAGTRSTYAVGRLVLWPSVAESEAAIAQLQRLTIDDGAYLAMANPLLAPYGLAAQQVLEQLKLWGQLDASIVQGENIAQTFQYVASGNASLGFVARSQLIVYEKDASEMWLVPAEMHMPINQQLIVLTDTDAARQFLAYIQSPAAQAIIRSYGYEIP